MSDLKDRLANLNDAQKALLSLRLEAKKSRAEPVAIIGMGCRFPGAGGLDAYWRLLADGIDAITEVPPSRWAADAYYDPDPAAPGKMNTRWGGFVRGIDRFDAGFFGISPREVEQMDPQQRLLLEVTWEALEEAGVRPDRLAGSSTGVFVGIFMDDYRRLQLADPTGIGSYAGTGSTFSIAANRISYQLDLRGPSLAVDTACSSSLVAIHLACQSLLNGETTLAIAGGVNLILRPEPTIEQTKAGLMSPDGRCKAFDAGANGYVRGEGAGVVVLKPLLKAKADGDPVYAVIRATAVNQDGRTNGITSPNRFSQEAVLREACRRAGVAPSQVQYVEAHGTGTAMGDAIECRALGAVYGVGRPPGRPLLVGSVKTNIGHLESGAGVASVIKVALAMRHGQAPATLHQRTPNPEIPFEALGLKVQTSLEPWPRSGDAPALAGVSSFGVGGTNVHLVLEEAPQQAAERTGGVERPLHVLTLSARTRPTLVDLARRFADRLAAGDGEPLTDLCYSANTGRTPFEHRLAAVGATREEIARQLAGVEDADSPLFHGVRRERERPKIAFLFTGQGSQYAGMGRGLFETQPTFRRALLRCQEAVAPHLDRPLLQVLFPEPGQEKLLDDTVYAQPALFALEYSLAELWRSWGIVPDALLGHSVGEIAAACVAGAFTLEEGLKLIARRARLMGELPRDGAMVAVFASAADVAAALAPVADRAAIAAINGPLNTVISGAREAVEAIGAEFSRRGVRVESLQVSHAFHCPLMEPMLEAFEEEARRIRYIHPERQLISNLTGEPFAAGEMSAAYWRRHARRPVRFQAGFEALRRAGCTVFLEIGPGTTLLGMAAKLEGEDSGVLLLPSLKRKLEDWDCILASLAALSVYGCEVDWHGFDRDYTRSRRRLPTYPFQRERFWCDERPASSVRPAADGWLLEHRIESPVLDGTLFESSCDAVHPAFLADHRVFGAAVFPAAGLIAMALEAVQAAPGQNVEMVDVLFGRPLVLPEGGERQVQLALTRERFEVYSHAREEEGWTLHARGEVTRRRAAGPRGGESVDAVRLRCPREMDGAAFYEELARRGIELGPSFRRVERAWIGDGEALGRLLPAVETGQGSGLVLHPGLLDSAFQVLSTTLPAALEDVSYLPVGIQRLRLLGLPEPPRWCHGRLRIPASLDASSFGGDLLLYGESGELVAEVVGLEVRRVESSAVRLRPAEPLSSWVHVVEWEPAPLPAVPREKTGGVWLIASGAGEDGRALAGLLAARGETAVEVDVSAGGEVLRAVREELAGKGIPCRGAVHFAGLSIPRVEETAPEDLVAAQGAAYGSALELVQTLVRLDRTGWRRLCIVTRGAQAVGEEGEIAPGQATLWGLGSVISYEHPELQCLLVDLDPTGPGDGAGEILAELDAPPDENRVSWRGGRRLVPRLVPSSAPALQGSPGLTLHADGTYLVTGGLGALGLEVARWMVRRGARHLALVGRNPERGAEAVEALRREGAEVAVLAADVARGGEVEAVLATVRGSMPPLRGVFHAAGILDDSMLLNETWSRAAEVMTPKILGAWNLHELTRQDPLDYFVLFSSAICYVPFPGMGAYSAANAFLDALALQRRREGLPAASLSWGPWAEAGMAASTDDISRGFREAEGVGLIPPGQGIELLERLLAARLSHAVVVPFDWPYVLQRLTPRERPLLAREMARRRSERPAAKPEEPKVDLGQILQAAPTEKRQEIIATYLREQMIQILRLPRTQELDPQRPLQAYGLDSLMAMTVRNRLKTATGRDLPATLLFDHQTLEDLSAYMHDLLAA